MSRYGADYRIARPTGVCAVTGRRLEPGTPCIATLCELPGEEGFERRDYSLEAWNAGGRPDDVFSHWKMIVPDPHAKQQVFVDDDVLLDLFESLAGQASRKRVAYRFLLSLVLMRKKLFRYAGRRGDNDGEQWLLVAKGAPPDQPPIEVTNPHLNDADVRELTEQLSEVLRGEL